MRIVRIGVRCALAQLRLRPRLIAALACLVLAAAPVLVSAAATPKARPTPRAPKTPLHAEFFVDVNRVGQVSHVTSVKPSSDSSFNTQTYGNAIQVWIRRPDGTAVPGLYRLTYDYDPKTLKVKRTVELVKKGGVDPNAPGMVSAMEQDMKQAAAKRDAAAAHAQLPDFQKIAHPTPSPR